jgi:hypothetical protein
MSGGWFGNSDDPGIWDVQDRPDEDDEPEETPEDNNADPIGAAWRDGSVPTMAAGYGALPSYTTATSRGPNRCVAAPSGEPGGGPSGKPDGHVGSESSYTEQR